MSGTAEYLSTGQPGGLADSAPTTIDRHGAAARPDLDAAWGSDRVPRRVGGNAPQAIGMMSRPVEGWRVAMFDALGCSGVARINSLLTDNGPVLNDVNTMPE